MLPDQEEVLMKANGLDLSLVKTEVLVSASIPEDFKNKSETLLQEYCRFLALKVIFGDTNLPLSLSPSAIIDQVWHIHMLMPGHYVKCCKELGVEIIEHDPSAARDALQIRRKRVEMTKKSYQVAFQKIPPDVFWAVTYNTGAYQRPSTSSSNSTEDEQLPAPPHKEDPVNFPKVEAKNEEDVLTVRVRGGNGTVYSLKIKRSTRFSTVYHKLGQLTGIEESSMYLVSGYRRVRPDDTASSLQLENDDVMEMMLRLAGC